MRLRILHEDPEDLLERGLQNHPDDVFDLDPLGSDERPELHRLPLPRDDEGHLTSDTARVPYGDRLTLGFALMGDQEDD